MISINREAMKVVRRIWKRRKRWVCWSAGCPAARR
jgi:hypothetical protein